MENKIRHFHVSGLRKKKLFRTREAHVNLKLKTSKLITGREHRPEPEINKQ